MADAFEQVYRIGWTASTTFPNQTGYTFHYLDNGWLQNVQGFGPNGSNGVVSTYQYNPMGRLTGLMHTLNGNLLSGFSGMKYDGAGNRLTMTTTVPAQGNAPDASRVLTYTYDHLDQLTGENSQPTNPGSDPYSTNYNFGFAYDAVGNPTQFRSQLTTPFNLDNQANAAGFGFDGNGNPTSYAGNSLAFDPENRATSLPGVQAGYDGNGLRAWKNTPGANGPQAGTFFLYDGDTLLAEEDQSGNVQNWYGYADGMRARSGIDPATGQRGDFQYFFDPSGNLANRVNGGNGEVHTAQFDAFGMLKGVYSSTSGLRVNLPDTVGFSGQNGCYTDPENHLVLMTHRYYDPGRGRWLNRDPIGYKGGINLYGYCGNNPVSRSDPSGRDWVTDFGKWILKLFMPTFKDGQDPVSLLRRQRASLGEVGEDETVAAIYDAEIRALQSAGNNMNAAVGNIAVEALAHGLSVVAGNMPLLTIPGRVQRRINLAWSVMENGAEVGGWNHVLARHFNGLVEETINGVTTYRPRTGAGQFSVSADYIRGVLQDRRLIQTPAQVLPGPVPRYVRIYDTGYIIGTTNQALGFRPTRYIEVITDGYGNLLTCYPSLP